MRIKQEVKKIIHQNIEEYALKVNKSSSTVKRWLYTDNVQQEEGRAGLVLRGWYSSAWHFQRQNGL